MRVGWMRIELLIPGSRSLKEKRRPLKSLVERLRNRFHVSVAEVAHQDLHQRATIGVAVVAADGGGVRDQMRFVREFVHGNPDCQVLDIYENEAGGGDSPPWSAGFEQGES